MSSGGTTSPWWCPRCLAATDVNATCPQCGLPQAGPDAARLRAIVSRLHHLGVEQQELASERAELLARLESQPPATATATAERRAGVPPQLTPTAAPLPKKELRADVVRDVLLWIGGILLAAAALIFAAFAWTRLADSGRAAMLVGTTLAAAGAAALLRPRLRATAEVLAALALALLLIDWYALRRAGVGENLDAPSWWAIGTAFVAVAGGLAGIPMRSPRFLMAASAAVSGILAVSANSTTALAAGCGLAVWAALLTAGALQLRSVAGWASASTVLVVSSVIVDVAGAMLVFTELVDDGPSPAAAAGVALTALPAVAARVLGVGGQLMVAVAAEVLLAAVSVELWHVLDEPWVLPAIAGVAAAVAIVALFISAIIRNGIAAAAATFLTAVTLASTPVVLLCLFGPFGRIDNTWEATASTAAVAWLPESISAEDGAAVLVTMLAVAVALLVIGSYADLGTPAQVSMWAGFAVVALGVDVLAVAADVTTVGALAITGGVTAAASAGVAVAIRRERRPLALGLTGLAAVVAVPAFGWSLATEGGTLTYLAGVLVTASAVVALSPDGLIRAAYGGVAVTTFIGLAAAAAAAVGGREDQVGVAVAAAAATAFVASSIWRQDSPEGVPGEVVGALGATIAVGLSWDDDVSRALTFSILAPAAAVAGMRSDRRALFTVGAALGVLASWCWLAAADVVLIEAYTAPAAVGAFAAGWVRKLSIPTARSWQTLAPGLSVALGPSLAVAIEEDATLRPALLAVTAVAVIAVGARWRLQAPIIIGSIVLLALAIDTLGPVAADLPRWITIGLAGLVLLWLGATAEARLAGLRRVRDGYRSLEQPTGE